MIEEKTICPECKTEIDAPAGQLSQCPGCNKLVRGYKVKVVRGRLSGLFKILQNKIDKKKGENR